MHAEGRILKRINDNNQYLSIRFSKLVLVDCTLAILREHVTVLKEYRPNELSVTADFFRTS